MPSWISATFTPASTGPATALQEFEAGVKADSRQRKVDYQKRIAEVLLSTG